MSIQLTSITKSPGALAHMGSDFIRNQTSDAGGLFANKRKSAVELLEASKGEYVKSTSVLNKSSGVHQTPSSFEAKKRPRSQTFHGETKTTPPSGLDHTNSLADRLSLVLRDKVEKREKNPSPSKEPSVADRLSQVLNANEDENGAETSSSLCSDNHSNSDKPSIVSRRQSQPEIRWKEEEEKGKVTTKCEKGQGSSEKPSPLSPPPLPPKRSQISALSGKLQSHPTPCPAQFVKINTSTEVSNDPASVASRSDVNSGSASAASAHSASVTAFVSPCLQPNTSTEKSQRVSPVMEGRPSARESDRLSAKAKDFLFPQANQSLSTSVTVLVEKRCAGANPPLPQRSEEVVFRRKKKTLHRSQSDLSCSQSRNSSEFSDLSSRLSRTSTELERFFNEMGIDRSVLDPMIKFQKLQMDSDLVDSLSSLDVGSREQDSDSDVSPSNDKSDLVSDSVKTKETKDLKDKAQAPAPNHVERNARIIKWLCNVKKARNTNSS